jgi:carbonic anhydrase
MKKWLTAFTVLSLSSAPALAQEWNHDPESPNGPLVWGDVAFKFATCGSAVRGPVGQTQSPIDITTATAIAADLPSPGFQYGSTPFVIENTGHVVEVPYEGSRARLVLGAGPFDVYELAQFHFHTDSEHAVDGKLTEMEVHLVHRNALGNLAVVGVLLQVGSNPNPLIEEIFANAPLAAETSVTLPGRVLNARDLLPRDTGSFWTYSGSLTTPPCSESVRWTVLKRAVNVSARTVARFRQIVAAFPGYEGFSRNNRPFVEPGARPILSR